MDVSSLISHINALRAERMFLVAHKKETLLFSDVSFGCPMGLEPMTFRTTI